MQRASGGVRIQRLVETRDSAFVDTDVLSRLRNWKVEEVVQAGGSTHNCIAQTGADAFVHNIRVTYARDALASEDGQDTAGMLRILSTAYRRPVQSNREIVRRLADSGSPALEPEHAGRLGKPLEKYVIVWFLNSLEVKVTLPKLGSAG